jgi:hypothetical protein
VTWTQDEKEELVRLWQTELTTAEIGRRLSKPKNAVVGKANRMHLPPRESPIKTSKPIKRRERRPPVQRDPVGGTKRRCLSCGQQFLSLQPKRVNRRCIDCDELLVNNGASFLTVYQATVLA